MSRDFTQSRNELVVIAKGVALTGRAASTGDAIAKDAPPRPETFLLPVGSILEIVSVSRTLPHIATFRFLRLKDGQPESVTAKLPVAKINSFAIPVLVPRRPEVVPS